MIAQLEKLKAANEFLIEKEEKSTATIQMLNLDLNLANKNLEEVPILKNTISKQEGEIAQMTRALQDTQTHLDDTSVALQQALDEIGKLKSEGEEQRRTIAGLQQDRELKTRLIKGQERRIERLRAHGDELTLQISSHKVQTTAARDRYRVTVREIDRMKMELDTLKESKHQYMLEKAENYRQVAMLSKEMPQLARDKQEAEIMLQRSLAQMEVVREEMKSVQEAQAASRLESNKEIVHLAHQIKEIFNIRWSEQRAIISDAKTIGTLPPPKKGQTRIDAAMKKALAEVTVLVHKLEGKVDEVTEKFTHQLNKFVDTMEQERALNVAHTKEITQLRELEMQARMAVEPLQTEMKMRKERYVSMEQAAVRAAVTSTQADLAKEEKEERERKLLTAPSAARLRPNTAPVRRSAPERVDFWGNRLNTKSGLPEGYVPQSKRGWNFWPRPPA